jgi:SOS-response transcriptional repressor LexA
LFVVNRKYVAFNFMSTKQSIGHRITSSRKKLGITIKALADRTEQFSAARINNWELGTRSPGPPEAIILADALGVSPAYLLCLSDSPKGDLHLQAEILPRYLPLISLAETNMDINELKTRLTSLTPYSDDKQKVTLDRDSKSPIGQHAFAIIISDNSMAPNFKPGDLIIADRDKKPNPGEFVIAHLKETNKNIIRKYRETNHNTLNHFHAELIASNPDWPSMTVNETDAILATVIEYRRSLVLA